MDDKPSGQEHLNEPSVLMQSPPRHASSSSEHSSRSWAKAPEPPRPGPSGHSWRPWSVWRAGQGSHSAPAPATRQAAPSVQQQPCRVMLADRGARQ